MRANHPLIPAEALARQARLQSALRAMEEKGPSLEPPCLKALQDLLAGRSSLDVDAVIEAIAAGDFSVEAQDQCRGLRRGGTADPALMGTIVSRLAPLAAKAQRLRSARWQLDTRRVLIRFSYAKEGNALDLDDGDLHALLLHAFRLEGLRLLFDLGKRPRPLLSVGLPLPAGVGGLAESMDAVLRQEPLEEPQALMVRLNHRLPAGVGLRQWRVLPGYASPVGELATLARWRWEVPPPYRGLAQAKVALFLETSPWPWDRGPSHPDGPLDLRLLVPELRLEGSELRFATAMGAHQAVNPLKMLGAILGVEPSSIRGLVRTAVDLMPDPRLSQADRFQPKLKNMYEDAVLLGGASNIILIDEDDDEPLVLGPPAEAP